MYRQETCLRKFKYFQKDVNFMFMENFALANMVTIYFLVNGHLFYGIWVEHFLRTVAILQVLKSVQCSFYLWWYILSFFVQIVSPKEHVFVLHGIIL